MLSRFEGTYHKFKYADEKFTRENDLDEATFLDESEVQTRISKVVHAFRLVDLHTLDWGAKYEQLGLDIYEWNAILTSVEHEFHTVFEDRMFESFYSLNEVKDFVTQDHNCF